MARTQKNADVWYEDAFDELYPLLYGHRDDDSAAREVAALLQLLGLGKAVRLLDVCCGAGRHMSAFSDAGLDVYGVDLSCAMLGRACCRQSLADRLVRADIRALPFPPQFDAVVNLFTSFGYFREDAANSAALAEMARVLRPGGRLVIDHINRAGLERSLVPEDETTLSGAGIHRRRWIKANRIRKETVVQRDGMEPVRILEDVRLYSPQEMSAMMEQAGLERLSFFGSFDGGALSENSERMIALANKPGRRI